MRKKWLLILIAVLAVAMIVGATACSSSGEREPKTQVIDIYMWEKKSMPEDPIKEAHPDSTGQLISEFYHWEPDVIVVLKGDTVVLNVSNPRGTIHGLAVPDFNIDTGPLDPKGGTATIEFVADKAGTYSYNCSTPPAEGVCNAGHKFMTGTIIVLDI
ncbi:MAG: hypothetical protein V3R31_00490 [Candidatus Humimicrobiaceae bacterium]